MLINQGDGEATPLVISDEKGAAPKTGILGVYDKVFGSQSIWSAIFNFSNSKIGAGVLFLPFVVSQTGIVLGLIFITFGGVLGGVTLYLLHLSYEKILEIDKNVKEYEEIGLILFGRLFSMFVQFCVVTLNIGCAITYCIIIGHTVNGWIQDRTIFALVLLGLLTPFVLISMSPKIASLRFSSTLAMVAIILFIVLLIMFYFLGFTQDKRLGECEYFPDFSEGNTWLHIFSVLGVVTFAYACHTNFYPIASEYKRKVRYKVGMAIFISVCIDFCLYSSIGAYGFLSFCQNTESDIIKSYVGLRHGWTESVLRSVLAVSVCLTYPMASYPARHTFNNFVKDIIELIMKRKMSKSVDRFYYVFMTIFVTILLAAVSYLMAVFYPFAETVFGLIGSTCSTCTAYVFPTLFYLKLHKHKWYDYRSLLAIGLLIFGLCFGTLVTVNAVLKIVQEGH